ncbi:MAG: hypothetical protein WDZ93_00890 [Candidatus Paceibacterota bacterium]
MNLKKKLAIVAVFACLLMPIGAQVEAYYPANTSHMTQQQLITYLYQLIAQLQAQLDAGQGGGYYGGTSSYGVTASTAGTNYVTEDSASLYGNVQLGRASTARVWFDYGTSQSFGQKSLTGTAQHSGHYSFRADVTGLAEDRTYYYRAVAEDPAGKRVVGSTRTFETDGDGYNDDDEFGDGPDVTTEDADDVEENSAELRGEVDMNDFRNGIVFFVYGQDEDQVEDIEDEYDEYQDIDEDGDDLQAIRVDRDLDGDESYRETVWNLEKDEEYFFQICVEYENEDDDQTIKCGGVEDFETDGTGGESNSGDEPDVTTEDAENVEDDEAELHGEVDMNDFENGIVFFVYGEDEDQVEDIENDYDTYSDIDEDGDDLQKVKMDSDLDGRSSYELRISGLEEETEYFFQICVEYEDEDDDDVLLCGGVEEFETED